MPEEERADNSATKSKTLETKADVKLIHNKDYAAYSLRLETHHQGMELWGSITPKQKGDIFRETDLIKLFKELELTGDIDRENMKIFCSKACLNQPMADVVLMRGREPQKGKDEHIDFLALPFSETPRYEKDVYGNIDYHKAHLFENVSKGQLIGESKPPGDGIPGESVTGDIIPASRGLPLDSHPKAGLNVRMSQQDGIYRYYAEIAGMILKTERDISVTDKYNVNDDAGMATGNIDFAGDVTITGNVQNEFNVKAGKSLIIKGTIGGHCFIESGGDMAIGGMTSNGQGRIICGGNLTAKYLDGITVESRGNITIKNEIVNCRVKSEGAIDVNQGSIIGGRYTALGGIDAKELGSEGGVKTALTAGVSFIAESKKKEVHKRLDPITREIEFLSKKLEPVMKNPKAMLALNHHEKERIKEQAKRFSELTPEQEKYKKMLEDIKKETDALANPMINARKCLERGVEITIGGITERISLRRVSPLTILRNSRRNELRFTSLHMLTEKAKEIERKIAQEEIEEERRQALKAKEEEDEEI
jgi:uncharacterized protein (DUF342 family)